MESPSFHEKVAQPSGKDEPTVTNNEENTSRNATDVKNGDSTNDAACAVENVAVVKKVDNYTAESKKEEDAAHSRKVPSAKHPTFTSSPSSMFVDDPAKFFLGNLAVGAAAGSQMGDAGGHQDRDSKRTSNEIEIVKANSPETATTASTQKEGDRKPQAIGNPPLSSQDRIGVYLSAIKQELYPDLVSTDHQEVGAETIAGSPGHSPSETAESAKTKQGKLSDKSQEHVFMHNKLQDCEKMDTEVHERSDAVPKEGGRGNADTFAESSEAKERERRAKESFSPARENTGKQALALVRTSSGDKMADKESDPKLSAGVNEMCTSKQKASDETEMADDQGLAEREDKSLIISNGEGQNHTVNKDGHKSAALQYNDDAKPAASDRRKGDFVFDGEDDGRPDGDVADTIKLPRFVDKDTLTLIKQYLAKEFVSNKHEHKGKDEMEIFLLGDPRAHCDEDEMALFMIRINRSAEQQTNFVRHNRMAQKDLMRKKEGMDFLSDDDEDEDTAQLIEEFIRLEEQQTLGRELLHKVVHNINKSASPTSKRRKGSKNGRVLDKRTMAWLRKSAGLQNSVGACTANHPGVKTIIESQGRRFTRGMARQQHDKKQQKRKKSNDESGLLALTSALDEMEQEMGRVFVRSKSLKKDDEQVAGRGDETALLDNSDVSARTKRRRSNDDGQVKTGKKKRCDKPAAVSEGDVVSMKPRAKRSAGSVSIRLEDWKLRSVKMKKGASLRPGEEESYDPRNLNQHQPSVLPKHFIDNGMILRGPAWPKVNPRKRVHPMQKQVKPPDAKRQELRAQCCTLMMRLLSGKARSRARYEFFYGDLDKAWYNRSEFVRQASRLGVPPGSRLTSLEWKAVRCAITRGKPRRFSKAFIDEQRRDRDRYRRLVRLAQTSTENVAAIVSELDCDEPIPSRIPAGSIVTAYNHRYRILQRGVVLSYESARNKYFIRFPPGYANLFVPDWEVARHGIPEFIVSGRTGVLGSSTREQAGATRGSGTNCRDLAIPSGSWGRKDYTPTKNGMGVDSSNNLINKEAEREMVSMILGTVESGIQRKNMILSCLEEISSGGEATRQLVAWLLANLDETNAVLDRAAHYMRSLYGTAYNPRKHLSQSPSSQETMTWLLSVRDTNFAEAPAVATGEQGTITRRKSFPSIAPTLGDLKEWSRRLILDSEDACRHFLAGTQGIVDDGDSAFILDRISAVGSLFLSSSFFEENIGSFVDVHGLQGMYYAQAQLWDRVESETQTKSRLSGSEALDRYGQVLTDQNNALDELNEAVNAFNAEISASLVQDCLG